MQLSVALNITLEPRTLGHNVLHRVVCRIWLRGPLQVCSPDCRDTVLCCVMHASQSVDGCVRSYGLMRRRHCVLPVGQAREGSARSPQGAPCNALHVYYSVQNWLQQSPARPCHGGDVSCQLCMSHCALGLCRGSGSWPATWARRPACMWTVPGRSQVRRDALLQMEAGRQLMHCRQQRLG